MPILTATEVTILSSITASAATIAAGKYIEVVQDRIAAMINNYFISEEIYVLDDVTFNASDNTITLNSGETFAEYGFADGDDIYLYRSYRNDGYYQISSISGSIATLASAKSVVTELSGATVYITMVRWPIDVKSIAANMVAYDYDIRGKKADNVKSYSMGPVSETFVDSSDSDVFGYPKKLTNGLFQYAIARLM